MDAGASGDRVVAIRLPPKPDTWNESTRSADDGGTAQQDTILPMRAGNVDAYLLLFEGPSSSVVNLPQDGEVVVGRGEGAQVRLRDGSVSRSHARITMTGGAAQIADLGSQNGTKVNGETIAGTRVLSSGDVITVLTTTMVFHSSVRQRAARQMLPAAAFRIRVEEEIDRVARSRRSFALVVVALADREAGGGRRLFDHLALLLAVDSQLRRIDAVALTGSELLLLLPEVDTAGARDVVQRVLKALRGPVPSARAGIAVGPADGNDVDVLMIGARAAAEPTARGELALAADTYRTIELDGRNLLVADPAMLRLIALLERLAKADLPVLVCGETGTGKELAATVLHRWSNRAARPLVVLNCAALPEALAESERFGPEKGAFTGAVTQKTGALEAADGGTVFLDELGELSLAVQAKLLRALETKRITRVGGQGEVAVDIRIVAATNRDLDAEVKAGRFRQDLLFRLGGATVWLPPLRDRRREIPPLAQRFVADACVRAGREAMTIAPEAMQLLLDYAWPGTVRELRNVIDYVVAAHDDPVVAAWHLVERLGGEGRSGRTRPPPHAGASSSGSHPLLETLDAPVRGGEGFVALEEEVRELEKLRMGQALEAAKGNQTAAAELLKMALRTFQAKAKAYGLRRKDRD